MRVVLCALLLLSLCVAGGEGSDRVTTQPTQPRHLYLCGAAVLKMCADIYGIAGVKLTDLITMVDESKGGTSLFELKLAARRIGFSGSEAVTATATDLEQIRKPVVLLVQQESDTQPGHYVLFAGMRDSRFLIADAVEGVSILTKSELERAWKGKALIISRTPLNLPSSHPAGTQPAASQPYRSTESRPT